MTLLIESTGQACGASVRGIDLSRELSTDEIREIRAAWLDYHVLAFPDQDMSDDDLERFLDELDDAGAEDALASSLDSSMASSSSSSQSSSKDDSE